MKIKETCLGGGLGESHGLRTTMRGAAYKNYKDDEGAWEGKYFVKQYKKKKVTGDKRDAFGGEEGDSQHEVLLPAGQVASDRDGCALHILYLQSHIGVELLCWTETWDICSIVGLCMYILMTLFYVWGVLCLSTASHTYSRCYIEEVKNAAQKRSCFWRLKYE